MIDFLERAFGAVEEYRFEEDGRVVHAFIRIGEALMEMADTGEGEIAHPYNFYMFTDDVDAVYRRAVAAGAKAIVPPADQPFGDRIAVLDDPFGNRRIPAKRIDRGV